MLYSTARCTLIARKVWSLLHNPSSRFGDFPDLRRLRPRFEPGSSSSTLHDRRRTNAPPCTPSARQRRSLRKSEQGHSKDICWKGPRSLHKAKGFDLGSGKKPWFISEMAFVTAGRRSQKDRMILSLHCSNRLPRC